MSKNFFFSTFFSFFLFFCRRPRDRKALTKVPLFFSFLLFTGSFLYLLGKPASSNESVSDKRLISSFMRESGNNCTLELIIAYQNILGMNIEVGTQTQSKAYTPITNKVIQKKNQTTHG